MKNNLFHILTAVALVVLLFLQTDPLMYWMPSMAVMPALLVATLLACVWAGFVMNETATDEREAMHRMNAGRIAYLAGIAVLTVALFWQGMHHASDPWIAIALATMVIVKLGARLFYESNG